MQELELWIQGYTLREIGDILDLSPEQVRQNLLQYDEYQPQRDRRLRDESIILDYTGNGELSLEDIADRYGLHPSSVTRICKGYEKARKPIGCDECKVNPYAKGLCRACYSRQLRNLKKSNEFADYVK